MVVFVCNSCNNTLRKSGVSQHLMRCRSNVISCCDCGVEFSDDSYKNHLQCVTEDVKYGPQDQKSLSIKPKGQIKQAEWLSNLKQILTKVKVSGPVEMALNKLIEYPNIPRKKAKFFNFAKSCAHIQSQDVINQLWNICEQANEACKEHESETNQSTDELPEDSKTEKKKRKKQDDEDEPEPESGEIVTKSGDDQEEGGDKENSVQRSGTGEGQKKVKKKKKQNPEESKLEKEDQDDVDTSLNQTEATPQDTQGSLDEDNEIAESIPISAHEQTETNIESTCDNPKKKSKKKKKRDNETNDDDDDKGNSNENENDSTKKLKGKEDIEGKADEKMDEDGGQSDPIPNEQGDSEQPINWFKQLKRQLKEKETVGMKEFKKMIKRIRKETKLNEDQHVLVDKALIKLKKRHNYSIAEGQIMYQRLF